MSFYVQGKGWWESNGKHYIGSKRKVALACARACGFENDTKTFTRLIIESRVARQHLDEQWRIGAQLRERQAQAACRSFNPLVNDGDYRGTICCTCGKKESEHQQ